jgi:biopolymer transport protein ExbB
MKSSAVSITAAIAMFCVPTLGAQTLDNSLESAAADYRARSAQAADVLNRTRERISAEKVPLFDRMRAAQDRVIVAESEASRFETLQQDASETRRKLLVDLDTLRKTTRYVHTLASDGLKAASESLAPGEDQIAGEPVRALREQLGGNSDQPAAAIDAAEFLLARVERSMGGSRATGQATIEETSEVVRGTFAFVGPETYFHPESGGAAGVLRPRDGSKFPVSYALAGWSGDDARRFFAGEPGTILADASGGKALRLLETHGTVWEHIRKGGPVAIVIVFVGLLAAVLIVQKVRDLRRMTLDMPAKIEAFLNLVVTGSRAQAEAMLHSFKETTRELFGAGLRYADQPASILEERLQAVLLRQRLRFERRLPLLAVIATAAPLMGLLGTVVGMVKTFALITVFGTGNAGKLSSGISEVLVATELGLVVAIPALVAHGFLAHRIQRNLSQLEHYALEFATSVGTAKADAREPGKEEVPV